jgi:hypothetical protein
MRRKRHIAVYDIVGSISIVEAENAISRAEKFILEVEMLIHWSSVKDFKTVY